MLLKLIEQRRNRYKRFVLIYAVISCVAGLILLGSIGLMHALHVYSFDSGYHRATDCGVPIHPKPTQPLSNQPPCLLDAGR